MPMTDYEEERCPFCRSYLTDIDGIWECQEGCGAGEDLHRDGSITWHTPDEPFQVVEKYHRQWYEMYDSTGKLIAGELYEIRKIDDQNLHGNSQ